MKKLIFVYFINQVPDKKTRLEEVKRYITGCLDNMDYAKINSLDVLDGYQYTELIKLKKEEKSLVKFIKRWDI